MLEDLVAAAVNDAAAGSRATTQEKMAGMTAGLPLAARHEAAVLRVKTPSSLEELIAALRCLPGVGPKSAQRMAYHLLQRDPAGAARLAAALTRGARAHPPLRALQHLHRGRGLRALRVRRGATAALLCVVESPGDLLMMEQAQCYRGLYFVLMGALSPLDGIGPHEIHLDRLVRRATDGVVQEVILATNFTVEGEATAHYIGEAAARARPQVTRIARGLPVGGELEHVDSGTLAQAVLERREVPEARLSA